MKHIYIYQDEGVNAQSLERVIRYFETIFKGKCVIKTLNADCLLSEKWFENASIFVMPGGRDVPYAQKLNGQGNFIIKNYVNNGGIYVGICAGAYYGSSSIVFAKNTDIEVVGKRELAFFSGVAIGPLIPYKYHSKEGESFLEIEYSSNKERKKVYYNGGCYFDKAYQCCNTKILARYGSKYNYKPAIIQCNYGKGFAILSGVHFECSLDNLIFKNL